MLKAKQSRNGQLIMIYDDSGDVVMVLPRAEALLLAQSIASAYRVRHSNSLPVDRIKQEHQQGQSLRCLAAKYEMSYATIRRIVQC